jgi:hypothetical protein
MSLISAGSISLDSTFNVLKNLILKGLVIHNYTISPNPPIFVLAYDQ